MKIEQAIEYFKSTNKFATFSAQTQRQYSYLLKNSLDLEVGGKRLREYELQQIDKQLASEIYTRTSERGTTVANQTRTAFNAMYTTLTWASPFNGAALIAAGKKTVTVEHVQQFLAAAYSTFKWRNAGLLMHMVYELGQDIKELIPLQWDAVDIKDGVVHVKGRAFSVSDELLELLKRQKKDFGFQEWVVPNTNVYKSMGYRPYGVTQISRTLKKIREAANLPKEFNVQEVRRLGCMSMLKDGYTHPEMAIVTGIRDRKELSRTIGRLLKDSA